LILIENIIGKNFYGLLTLVVLASLLASCVGTPRYAIKRDNDKESINNIIDTAKTGEIMYGPASYYADKFHGRNTSNGETYDMHELTAAHPTLPFNTVLRITNTKNQKAVIVRINDRMPVHKERIIDISYAAAEQLDMLRDGVVNVQIEVLETGE